MLESFAGIVFVRKWRNVTTLAGTDCFNGLEGRNTAINFSILGWDPAIEWRACPFSIVDPVAT